MQNDRNGINDLCTGALKRRWAVHHDYAEDEGGKKKLLCVEDLSSQRFERMEAMDDTQNEAEYSSTDSSK
jgi:hypothetical protein